MTVDTAVSGRATGPRRRFAARQQRPGLWFALPAILLLVLFFAYPLVMSLLQSLFRTKGGVNTFVGLGQYSRMLADPIVGRTLINAFMLLVVQVPLMISLAVLIAYILNQSWLRFRSGFRLMTFLPAVTTLVAYAVVFRVMLQTDGGVFNQLLGMVGIGPIDWLYHEWWARVALVAAITWRWTGYNMVIILAGLQSIPHEIYEAAQIDGAGRWATFWQVVLPNLRPVLIFTSVTSTIGALQLFDESLVLTEGGPNDATLMPVMYLYRVGFQQFDFGYASAIAWMIVVLTAIVSLVQLWLMREKDR